MGSVLWALISSVLFSTFKYYWERNLVVSPHNSLGLLGHTSSQGFTCGELFCCIFFKALETLSAMIGISLDLWVLFLPSVPWFVLFPVLGVTHTLPSLCILSKCSTIQHLHQHKDSFGVLLLYCHYTDLIACFSGSHCLSQASHCWGIFSWTHYKEKKIFWANRKSLCLTLTVPSGSKLGFPLSQAEGPVTLMNLLASGPPTRLCQQRDFPEWGLFASACSAVPPCHLLRPCEVS